MNGAVIVSALAWGGSVALLCHGVVTGLLRLRFPPALEERPGIPTQSVWERMKAKVRSVLRREDTLAQIEEVAVAMAFQLKAGSTMYGALSEIARGGKGSVYETLRRVVQLYGTGLPLTDSLESALGATESPELSHLFSALQVGLVTGGNVPLLLTRTAEMCRRRRSFQKEISAKLAESRMTAAILIFLPWLVFLVAGGLEPGFFSDLLSYPSGKMLVGVSLAMWLLGVVFVCSLVGSVYPGRIPSVSRSAGDSPLGRWRKGPSR